MAELIPNCNNALVATIKTILSAPEWFANKPIWVPVKATNLLDKLEHFDESRGFATQQEATAWGAQPYNLELEPKEKETLKFCLEHFLSKGAVRLSKEMCILVKFLGITGE